MKKNRLVNITLVSLLILAVLLTAASALKTPNIKVSQASSNAVQPSSNTPIPVLAYYYIWYDSNSWDRTKSDLPLLGSYTSDDITVMRQHIQEAKAAGITGFIVSWKGTDVLNRRLKLLAQVAEQENFKLAVIYQGLDFNRNPLPVDQVASDMDYFIQNFASLPVFQFFLNPMVIWSGTWKFSTQDIKQVTKTRRNSILILASERDLAGFSRLANFVDGEAYYWSSVNPATYAGIRTSSISSARRFTKIMDFGLHLLLPDSMLV
jgi:hypothetical protein